MSLWWKLTHLLPFVRRSRERQMREVLASLREMAAPGELGNLTLAAEDARAAWTWTWVEGLRRDLGHAVRAMRRSPLFTAFAVLSLSLGIGANTAIYGVIESIAFRTLPRIAGM